MTENQPNSDISNHVKQQECPLQNTQDPLPWLIRNLRNKKRPEVTTDSDRSDEPRSDKQ